MLRPGQENLHKIRRSQPKLKGIFGCQRFLQTSDTPIWQGLWDRWEYAYIFEIEVCPTDGPVVRFSARDEDFFYHQR